MSQTKLSAEQIAAFYHDEFVEDQVRDFCGMDARPRDESVIVDIGGGCGFFARRLSDATGVRTRVLDTDPQSVRQCRAMGVDALHGDALAPEPCGDEGVVCFNLILHHLVGGSERETRSLQKQALQVWKGRVPRIFVNEYIYQSFVPNWSGRLIYEITSSRFLSLLGKLVSRVVPAFRANTFGVGVRFRSDEEWRKLFAEAGFTIASHRVGAVEPISPPLRCLMIKTIRRDSYLLEAA